MWISILSSATTFFNGTKLTWHLNSTALVIYIFLSWSFLINISWASRTSWTFLCEWLLSKLWISFLTQINKQTNKNVSQIKNVPFIQNAIQKLQDQGDKMIQFTNFNKVIVKSANFEFVPITILLYLFQITLKNTSKAKK